jgi:hypothetical protein
MRSLMSPARWLARNWVIRTSASPREQNGSSRMILSIATVTDRDDHAAVPGDLSPRDQEVTGFVVLLQKLHVRRHRGIDLLQRCRVDQVNDEQCLHAMIAADGHYRAPPRTTRVASQSRTVLKYSGTKRCSVGISVMLPTRASHK